MGSGAAGHPLVLDGRGEGNGRIPHARGRSIPETELDSERLNDYGPDELCRQCWIAGSGHIEDDELTEIVLDSHRVNLRTGLTRKSGRSSLSWGRPVGMAMPMWTTAS